MEIVKIKTSKIKLNDENPRTIKDSNFQKLIKSVKEFPEMLEIRPIVVDENMIVLGGNMRFRACLEAGMKEVPTIIVENLTEDQKKEFIVKDNVSGGDWDWEMLRAEWDVEKLDDWGLEIPLDEKIDKMNDGDELVFEQSVQLEPPKEYILIMAEPNSEEWEEIKQMLKLKMVRRGGYREGSAFDAVGLERVIKWDDFKNRLNVNSDTK